MTIDHRKFAPPPRALRERNVRLYNIAILPASLLPSKAEWQKVANDLPAGTVPIVLPESSPTPRKTLATVADLLRAKGQPVAIVTAERLR